MTPSASHPPLRREYLRWLRGVAVLLALYGVTILSGVEPERLTRGDGLSLLAELLRGFARPDFSAHFFHRVLRLMVESFAIGFVGLGLALCIGVPLALLGARLPSLQDPPGARSPVAFLVVVGRLLVRSLLSVLRSVPEIIWAFLFVRILGLGPGPAVLAIGLTFGGIIGKLFSELIESAPPEAGRRLRASGASPLGVALYGVLPLVRRQWVGYGLFRLECAIRSASVLGVVGAGGIGAEIDLSIRYFEYDKLATALLAVLCCVVLLELLSFIFRQRHVGWSLLLLGGGALAGVASLNIRWSQLVSGHALEQLMIFGGAFLDPQREVAWGIVAAGEMLTTLCMATVATALAAGVAFLLAPLVSRQLAVSGYLGPLRVRRWSFSSAAGAGMLFAVRGVFQVTRALPELVWALVFVMWVGPGPMAGILAIAAHTVGIFGRLFAEVYEDIDPALPRAIESRGGGRLAVWGYGVLPQALRSLLSYTLFRFEVNIRSTAMIGFVGAGGIGNSIHTAISLFHFRELASLLLMLVVTVILVDLGSSALRRRIMQG